MGRLMETTPEVFEETWRLHTLRRISVGAASSAGDARARQRYDSDHWRDRRHPAVANFSGVRAGQICCSRTWRR